jgi:HlyD family secretion protein
MKRAILILAVLALATGGVVALNAFRSPSDHRVDWRIVKLPAKEVEVDRPVRGEIVQTLIAPGVVQAKDEANVASQIVGRVVEVRVEKGDTVKKGQLLVKLDDTDAKARLDSVVARIDKLNAAIQVVEADRAKAIRDRDISSRLAVDGVATATELADHETIVAKTGAALIMARHELTESQATKRELLQNLEYTEIKCPQDGVVLSRDVEVGEIVIAGTTNLPGTVLMKIADLNRMEVKTEVDETDVLLLRRDQPARIFLQADPQTPVPGIVDLLAPKGTKVGDAVSFETLVTVKGKHESVRAGMSATVEIEVRRAKDVLSVPVQAVVHRRRKDLPDTPLFQQWAERETRVPGEKKRQTESRYVKIVFVVEGSVVRARPVETGISDERRVEIIGNLTANEQVVVGPFRVLDELKDGQDITITEGGEARP